MANGNFLMPYRVMDVLLNRFYWFSALLPCFSMASCTVCARIFAEAFHVGTSLSRRRT